MVHSFRCASILLLLGAACVGKPHVTPLGPKVARLDIDQLRERDLMHRGSFCGPEWRVAYAGRAASIALGSDPQAYLWLIAAQDTAAPLDTEATTSLRNEVLRFDFSGALRSRHRLEGLEDTFEAIPLLSATKGDSGLLVSMVGDLSWRVFPTEVLAQPSWLPFASHSGLEDAEGRSISSKSGYQAIIRLRYRDVLRNKGNRVAFSNRHVIRRSMRGDDIMYLHGYASLGSVGESKKLRPLIARRCQGANSWDALDTVTLREMHLMHHGPEKWYVSLPEVEPFGCALSFALIVEWPNGSQVERFVWPEDAPRPLAFARRQRHGAGMLVFERISSTEEGRSTHLIWVNSDLEKGSHIHRVARDQLSKKHLVPGQSWKVSSSAEVTPEELVSDDVGGTWWLPRGGQGVCHRRAINACPRLTASLLEQGYKVIDGGALVGRDTQGTPRVVYCVDHNYAQAFSLPGYPTLEALLEGVNVVDADLTEAARSSRVALRELPEGRVREDVRYCAPEALPNDCQNLRLFFDCDPDWSVTEELMAAYKVHASNQHIESGLNVPRLLLPAGGSGPPECLAAVGRNARGLAADLVSSSALGDLKVEHIVDRSLGGSDGMLLENVRTLATLWPALNDARSNVMVMSQRLNSRLGGLIGAAADLYRQRGCIGAPIRSLVMRCRHREYAGGDAPKAVLAR